MNNTAKVHLAICERASTLSHPLERFDAIIRELYQRQLTYFLIQPGMRT
jgi:hypothetical protein